MKTDILSTLVDLGVMSYREFAWFGFLFGCMRMAGEEVEAAIKKHPRQHHAAIDEAFKHACCTEMLRRKGSYTLYRAHVREIIARMIAGADVRPGTDAEVLALVSELSFVGPLTREYYAVYLRLFSGIYPEHMAAIGNPDWKKEEPWPGHTDELIANMRRKLASQRGLEPKAKKAKKKGATLEIPSPNPSGVSPRPQNGNGARDRGLPRQRGARPQDGRRQHPVRRDRGNPARPLGRRPRH